MLGHKLIDVVLVTVVYAVLEAGRPKHYVSYDQEYARPAWKDACLHRRDAEELLSLPAL